MNTTAKRMLVSSVATFAGLALVAGVNAQRATQDLEPVATTTTTMPTTTTTTMPPAPTTTLPDVSNVDFGWIGVQEAQSDVEDARTLYGKCGEWRSLALAVGWPESEWLTLSKVMWRESRCEASAHNGSDPRHGSSYGSISLLQINSYWCLPSKYSEKGWLQDRDVINSCDDLFDPEKTLRSGLLIWMYGEQKHGCGWSGPWQTKCTN